MALDRGWFARPPQPEEALSTGEPRSFGNWTRKPSSLAKGSDGSVSRVGVCGGVMFGSGLKRLGGGSGAADALAVRIGMVGARRTNVRSGEPGRLKWMVLGRNLHDEKARISSFSGVTSKALVCLASGK